MQDRLFENKYERKNGQNRTLIRETLHYGGEIDAGELISVLKEHELKGISFNPREHKITYPSEQRAKIEAVLNQLGIEPDTDETIH